MNLTCNDYISIIDERLEYFYNNNLVNKNELENIFRKFFNDVVNNFPLNKSKFVQFFYDLKIVTSKDIKRRQRLNKYSANYERKVNTDKININFDKLKVVYTNANTKDLNNFDYSKVYIILDEKTVPDLNYSYIIKESIFYLYIPKIKYKNNSKK